MQQTLLGQDQVHGADAAQAVQRLQLWDLVFPFLKLTCSEEDLELVTEHKSNAEPEKSDTWECEVTYWPTEDMRARPQQAAAL